MIVGDLIFGNMNDPNQKIRKLETEVFAESPPIKDDPRPYMIPVPIDWRSTRTKNPFYEGEDFEKGIRPEIESHIQELWSNKKFSKLINKLIRKKTKKIRIKM